MAEEFRSMNQPSSNAILDIYRLILSDIFCYVVTRLNFPFNLVRGIRARTEARGRVCYLLDDERMS